MRCQYRGSVRFFCCIVILVRAIIYAETRGGNDYPDLEHLIERSRNSSNTITIDAVYLRR